MGGLDARPHRGTLLGAPSSPLSKSAKLISLPHWNKLFYGDNLTVLREHVPASSVDLVYLDSPFNSRADYNVLFAEKDGTQSTFKQARTAKPKAQENLFLDLS